MTVGSVKVRTLELHARGTAGWLPTVHPDTCCAMSYKMLVLDLDGTALVHRGQVHPDDVAAAERLRKAGIHVTISTGRLYTGTEAAAQALGVQGSVAVMNGSEYVDAQTGATDFGAYLDDSQRRQLRSLLGDHGIHPFLFASRTIHLCHSSESHAPYLSIWGDALTRHPDIQTSGAWNHADLLAVCGVAGHEAVSQAAGAVKAALPGVRPTEFTTFTGEGFLELRAEGYDKGTSLDRLAAERELHVDEVIAVGDWLNDIPMLKRAGLSFAMAGSIEEATDAADEVLEAERGAGGAVAEIARRVWGL